MEAPGYRHHLFGIDQLLINVEEALRNLTKAEERLAKAPGPAEIEQVLANQQEKYAKVLETHSKDAVKFFGSVKNLMKEF